jgi:chromosome partitioning protein
MITVVVAAEKGGVGKTTLAVTLAVIATLSGTGARVGLLDADPQGSLTTWWNIRVAEWPLNFSVTGTIAETVAAIAVQGLDFLFIDTPPGYTAIREQAIACADLVLIPTGPGSLDLAGIESTAEIANRARIPYRVALNRAAFRTRLTGDAVLALRELNRFLEPVVHNRQPIIRAIESGRAVVETEPDTPGAAEVRGLWAAIMADLVSLQPRKRAPKSAARRAA